MALDHFIPEIWKQELLMSLNKNLVAAAVATDYSAELVNGGDTVHLGELIDPTIAAYTKNSSTLSPTALQSADKILKIDNYNTVNYYIEDIDKAQTNNIARIEDRARLQAMYLVRNALDTSLMGLHSTAGLSVGTTGSPIDITSTNVVENILACYEDLGDNNAPIGEATPFLIIPQWFMTKLVLAGVVSASDPVATAAWANGAFRGNILGFNIYASNNVSEASADTNVKVLYGLEKFSLGFAQGLYNVEAKRASNRHADEYRFLHGYGVKTVFPNATGCLFCTLASEV